MTQPLLDRLVTLKRPSALLLIGLSALLMCATISAHYSGSESERLSIYVALSPFIVLVWLLTLATLTLSRHLRAPALISAALCVTLGLSIWPVSWLLRREASVAPPPQLRLTTWNVERLGELDRSDRRSAVLDERLSCVSEALKDMDSQLIVLQEISKRRLKALKGRLDLSCQHVDYYGRGGSWRGGLATCASNQGPWEITQARDFALGGDWRALFVEVKRKGAQDERSRFNILNVHFSPHGLGARDLKQAAKQLALGSPSPLSKLLKQVARNMRKQEEQVEGLLRAINTLSDPTIIAGDFNAPPYTSLHRAFVKAGDGAWVDAWSEAGVSFGATRYLKVESRWVNLSLPLRIDYIYTLKRGFELGSVSVPSAECSDHRALHLRALLKPPSLASAD